MNAAIYARKDDRDARILDAVHTVGPHRVNALDDLR